MQGIMKSVSEGCGRLMPTKAKRIDVETQNTGTCEESKSTYRTDSPVRPCPMTSAASANRFLEMSTFTSSRTSSRHFSNSSVQIVGMLDRAPRRLADYDGVIWW